IIQKNKGNLKETFKTLMTSEVLFAKANEKSLPKNGFDVIFGFLRSTHFPVNQRTLTTIMENIGQSLGEPGNNPGGRIFGWLSLQLNGEVYVIDRRNAILSIMNHSADFLTLNNYSLYDSLIAGIPETFSPAESLIGRLAETFGLRLNQAQIDRLATYLNYNWETCDGNEAKDFGCTEGEKFAKREAFDPAPDAQRTLMEYKVEGLLVILATLDEFFVK
ncbi:MAG: hypothetical protein KDD60_09150, partial [Bdellovibrionales bacterium]|nr:hypothetical protein [Bdellovibrionales bacterium]